MNNRRENESVRSNENLTVDELAASLCRQISGEVEVEAQAQADPDKDKAADIENDLLKAFSGEEQPKDDPESLIEELQKAVAKTGEGFGEEKLEEDQIEEDQIEGNQIEDTEILTVEPMEEAEDKTEEEICILAEESASEQMADPEIEEAETAAEETEEAETAAEETEEAETAAEETEEAETTSEDTIGNTSSEEAFDTADAGVLDVSPGVLAMTDAPTAEIPNIPLSIPVTTEKEKKREEKDQKKEDKARLKEDRKREKQEAKEQKRKEKEEKKAGKKKGPFKIILLLLLLLIAAAAVVYLALSNRYKTVFFDGTKINGADCTGLTVEEAETVIARQMDAYELTLIFRDGKKEVISGDEIGFEYVPDGSVQEIKDSQVPIMWATAFFDEYVYDATAAISYDSTRLNEVVTALDECNLVKMQAPENAYVTYNEEQKTFEIVPEQNGNKFDLSALLEAVAEAVPSGIREINVEELGIYETPAITKEDAGLNEQKDDMNQMISASVTHKLPTGTEKVLDATTLVTWISKDEAGNYYVDPENWGAHVANYVEELAREVNTSDSKADFKTQSGSVVSLDNYLQGWLIDEEEEGLKLTEELSNHETVSREPIYAQRAYSNENNGIGNTYVEVDLSAQCLWVVDNGQVIIESPVVSGMMVTSRYTPDGIYALYGKQAGRWLRGYNEDGSLNYESWVDYWMPFNGGIGLHDASWRGEFGGSTYIGGGSHGCVNLPVSKAAAIFDWITAGTPIVCYYSNGCSVSPDGTYGEE